MEVESGFNQDHNDGKGILDSNGLYSYGLCMWNGPRFTALKDYCAKHNLNYRSISGQLSYLNHELKNDYNDVYKALYKANNTAQGAYDAIYKVAATLYHALVYQFLEWFVLATVA